VNINLTINDIPIFGIVGNVGNTATISVSDCWLVYCRYFKDEISSGLPVTVISKLAEWRVNGQRIDKPKSWFIMLNIA